MIERIVSWGLDAPAKFAPTLKVRKGNARYRRGYGKVKVRIIHGLTLVIKNSYTYCKSFISPRSKVLLRMLLGGRLVGFNHRAPPTSTQGKAIKRAPYAINLLHNIYHMCMLRDLPTSTQVLFKFIITQLA